MRLCEGVSQSTRTQENQRASAPTQPPPAGQAPPAQAVPPTPALWDRV